MSSEFVVPDTFVRKIANGSIPLSQVKTQCELVLSNLGATPTKRVLKALVQYAQTHKARQQYGRLCGAVIIGFVWFGESFIERLNGDRLLISSQPTAGFESALADLLARLSKLDDALWATLKERVNTYLALYRLYQEAGPSASERSALAERPFSHGKALLALANWAFLRHSFNFEADQELDNALSEFRTQEDVAAGVSAVLALTNGIRPLESMDFTLPLVGPEFSRACVQLLDCGRRVSILSETEKLVSILGYRLSMVRDKPRKVFTLGAPFPELENALRLGFVRGEIGVGSSRLRLAEREGSPPQYSIMAAVKLLLDSAGAKLIEIKDPDEQYRRIRTHIPLLPSLFDTLPKFYEDFVMEEQLAQELELPIRIKGQPGKWDLVNDLDVNTFHRAWRALQFVSLIDIAAVQRHQTDSRLVRNSLMRVMGLDQFKELLNAFGLSTEQSSAFLKLVVADVNKLGHLDLQYRPFLLLNPSTIEIDEEKRTHAPEIVHAPALVALSNMMPNVQRAHGIRISTNADAFVAVAAEQLKALFSQVKTNAAVALGDLKTDVDIVALGDESVYLFECKHSLTPTGAHEFRDLWQDINKGISQLEVAKQILEIRMKDYLAGWFPGTDRRKASNLTIKRCVLCSHRVFSGLSIRGIPVRDHASLSLILDDAVVRMGYSEDGTKMAVKRYRLRGSDNPTVSDLDAYLGDQSIFFAMFQPFMRSYTRIDALSSSVVLAQDSFLYEVGESEWSSHLERIGAVRLNDVALTLGPLPMPENLRPGESGPA